MSPSAARLTSASGDGAAARDRSEDEHLAFVLVTIWALRTGRRLRKAPLDQLTEEDLIDFWSDPAFAEPSP